MKKNIKMSKKKTNKINNRKCSFTGGSIMPPKWQLYGYKTEAAYLAYLDLEEEQQRIERERRERVINAVLNNVFINFIMTIIMNLDQSQIFEAYIRENIRIVNRREELNPMIDNFVNFARTDLDLLDEEQRLQINRILDAVQRKRERANRPLESMEIYEIMERVFRKKHIYRSDGGEKKYYKYFTRKNRFNRRNKNYLPSVL
jgi:hypothetical protein